METRFSLHTSITKGVAEINTSNSPVSVVMSIPIPLKTYLYPVLLSPGSTTGCISVMAFNAKVTLGQSFSMISTSPNPIVSCKMWSRLGNPNASQESSMSITPRRLILPDDIIPRIISALRYSLIYWYFGTVTVCSLPSTESVYVYLSSEYDTTYSELNRTIQIIDVYCLMASISIFACKAFPRNSGISVSSAVPILSRETSSCPILVILICSV